VSRGVAKEGEVVRTVGRLNLGGRIMVGRPPGVNWLVSVAFVFNKSHRHQLRQDYCFCVCFLLLGPWVFWKSLEAWEEGRGSSGTGRVVSWPAQWHDYGCILYNASGLGIIWLVWYFKGYKVSMITL